MTSVVSTDQQLSLLLHIGCEFAFSAAEAVATSVQVGALPHESGQRIVRQAWRIEPTVSQHCFDDLYGNPNRRMVLAAGHSTIFYDAVVGVSPLPDATVPDACGHPAQELPDDTLIYTLPSRYCLSDLQADLAWQLFGATPPGWARVQAVCDWIHAEIAYRSGSSHSSTTSFDVYASRTGICRDFAHLGISFCRALNIPARYVFGYLPDIDIAPVDTPMDFHAWFEAYLGGSWHTFDARHNTPRVGRVAVGRGRDAVDCAMVTSFGPTTLVSMKVWADRAVEGE